MLNPVWQSGSIPNDGVVGIQGGFNNSGASFQATIPHDNTPPLIGEGVEYLSQTITCKRPSSFIFARALINIGIEDSGDPQNLGTAALFAPDNSLLCANTIFLNGDDTTMFNGENRNQIIIYGAYFQSDGVDSQQTFSVRVGRDLSGAAAELYGNYSNTTYGSGNVLSWLILEEVL